MNYREVIAVVANLIITTGYIFLAFRVVPRAAVRLPRTRYGGIVFFTTCGLTHLELALHTLNGEGMSPYDMYSWHMLAIHVPQAISVWAFVTGIYLEFVKWGPWSMQDAFEDDEEL